MQYTQLGLSDLRVSRLCMGTVFRSEGDVVTCVRAIHAAAELGCNFLDCANVYRDGHSEQIVGRALAGRRDRFVVSTKVGSPMPGNAGTAGLGRDNIIACCEASLRRLGTDYLDCYLCHHPDPDTPIEETLAAFDHLVRQGKVRFPGVSNFPTWQLYEALLISRQHAWADPVCNQVGYSLLDRRVENELVPFCERSGVGITVYAATAIGLLSGRCRWGQPPPAGSSWDRGPYNFRAAMTAAVGQVIDTLVDIAQRNGRTPLQAALAWCLRVPVIRTVIVGTDTEDMARENFAAADWELTAAEIEQLDRVSQGHCLTVRKDCPEGYAGSAPASPE